MGRDNRKITCLNKTTNSSIEFGDSFNPYLLTDADGLYEMMADVTSNDNGMQDGSTYIGTRIKARNIVLTVKDKASHASNRNFLYLLFAPKSEGTLTYSETDAEYKVKRAIDYYVESVSVTSTKQVRTATVSLLCCDPYFSDINDTSIVMTGWENAFEFIHEFKTEGEEFASIVVQKMVEFYNDSTASNIGFTIVIDTEGDVSNPRIYQLETDEYIQIGNDSYPLNLQYGDQLTISTVTNNKNVYLKRDGVTTNINNYVTEGSKYIQLVSGTNTISYSASVGEDNLRVLIKFKNKYLGV